MDKHASHARIAFAFAVASAVYSLSAFLGGGQYGGLARWAALAFALAFLSLKRNMERTPLEASAFLVLVVFIYLLPVFSGYDNIGGKDWDQIESTYQSIKNTVLVYRQLPLWNPYLCGGTVQLAYPGAGFPTPFIITHLLFQVPHAVKINLILYLTAAAIGCYLLSKELKLTTTGAIMFSLTFALSGYFAARIGVGHMVFMSLFFLPYILVFLWRSLKNIRYAPPAAVFAALYICEAHPYLITNLVVFLSAYAVFLSLTGLSQKSLPNTKTILRPIACALVIGILSVLLASVKIMPAIYFTGWATGHRATGGGFNLPIILDALAKGTPTQHPHQWGWHEFNGYIGPVGLMLAFLGMWATIKDRRLSALALTLVVLVVYSFGDNSPIPLWGFFHSLPFFSVQHIPSRTIGYIVFILALFSGVGLTRIERRNRLVACMLLAVSVILLFLANGTLIETAFNTKPMSDSNRWNAVFYQTVGEKYGMYDTVAANKGVLNCYAPGGLRSRNAKSPANQGYNGEAYLTGKGTVETVVFTPNEVRVNVRTDSQNTLVLNQNYQAGWNANGKPAKNTRGLVSSDVSPGEHTVFFTYTPPGFRLGLGLTLAGILASLALWKTNVQFI